MDIMEKQKELKEKEFLEHVREVCAGCQECGSIDFIKDMIETGTDFSERTLYLCSDCFQD